MSELKLEKPQEFRREQRLGLVVYGGVALAIYMNGICREFYNAVRGRGVYKLVKALTDADIVVDIISGTSAGGINGVLLSFAIANSQRNEETNQEEVVDFANFAQIWRESGNIRKLLHHPILGNKPRDRESLLDGADYYQTELQKAFADGLKKKTTAPDGEWLSPTKELDLFVTGTDILGRIYSLFDDTGATIEVKEHRAMFHLKYRQGRKNPFVPQGDGSDKNNIAYKALGKLCRITSCFPVAFPVVTVKLKDFQPENREDKDLVYWGWLNNRILPEDLEDRDYQLHFVDGGVLDNRPFTHTINAIYYRMANRPIARKLFYIDPSPDRLAGSKTFRTMPRPNIWQVVQDSLVGMPSYESIANDLKLIKKHNEKVKRYHALLDNAEEIQLSIDKKNLKEPSPVLFSGTRQGEEIAKKSRKKVQEIEETAQEDLDKVASEGLRKGESVDRETLEKLQAVVEKTTEQTQEIARKAIQESHEMAMEIIQGFPDRVYWRSRLFSLRDRVLPPIFAMDRVSATYSEYNNQQTLLAEIAELLIQPITEGESSEQDLHLQSISEQIRDLDLDYALRKHFYIVQKIHQLMDEAVETHLTEAECLADYKRLRLLAERLNRNIKLLEILQATLEKLLSCAAVRNYFQELIRTYKTSDRQENNKVLRNGIYAHLIQLHRFLLDVITVELPEDAQTAANTLQQTLQGLPKVAKKLSTPGDYAQLTPEVRNWLDRGQLNQIYRQFQQKANFDKFGDRADTVLQKIFDTEVKRNSHSFLRYLEAASIYAIANSNLSADRKRFLKKCFVEFKTIDKLLYPFEYLTDVREKQPIKTIRISPDDSKLGMGKGKGLEDKLAGDTLAAFGGFFKKSWRANDILWGRLDGLNRLLESLLTRESLTHFPKFLKRQAQEHGISTAAGTDEFNAFKERYFEFLIQESFPKLDDRKKIEKLKAHLDRLLAVDRLSDGDLRGIINDFVMEGHRAIIRTDLQEVILDEIAEQIDWNLQSEREPTSDRFDSQNPKPKYNPVPGYFEKNVSAIAAATLAKESLSDFGNSKEQFFRDQYKVGEEKLLDNLPSIILVNLAARAALVFRDIVNTLLGSRAFRVRRNWKYKIVDRGLQLFYGWLQYKGPLALQTQGSRRNFLVRLFAWLLQVALFFIAVICVAFVVIKLPKLIALVVFCAIAIWLLNRF